MPAHLKNVGSGTLEHSKTKEVIGNDMVMTDYERGMPKILSHLQARMERGSIRCEKSVQANSQATFCTP